MRLNKIFTTIYCFRAIVILLLLIVLPNYIYANAGFDDETYDTPIDGGLSLLVAAGIGYGARKIKSIQSEK